VRTVDQRIRDAGDAVELGADWLLDDLPRRLADTGRVAARGVRVLGLSTLGFDVDGTTVHLVAERDRLIARPGSTGDGVVARLDPSALSELAQDETSLFGLTMGGRVELLRGTADELVAWEPVLRAALDERPVYEPGTIAFRAPNGDDLDLRRTFRLDDSPEEIGHFLTEAGFVHLEGVFTEAEMEAVAVDLDDAAAAATQHDGESWWARTGDGWYAARVLGFNRKSPALQDLLESERFGSLALLTDDEWVQRPPREGDSAEGLWKKVGVVEGISDVSWHKDCAMGGHSRRCCGLTVGVAVTGADQRSGELGAVAGSHRANVQLTGVRPDLDLPRIPLPTTTGDVTIHCSCTLHMSRPPVDRERKVVYTGFDLARRPGEGDEATDPTQARQARASLNDQVREFQRRDDFGNDADMFELPATDAPRAP
jgi:hypothetical protein